MDCFFEKGGNTIDTARLYGCTDFNGESLSEITVGKWVKANNMYGKAVIITKGGHPDLQNRSISRLDRKSLLSDIDRSLNDLNISQIDMYFLHRDDPVASAAEIMETLAEAVKAGKIKHIGASNWRFDRIMEANRYAEAHNLPPFEISQIQWSVVATVPERYDATLVCMNKEEYAKYNASQFPVLAYAAQAKGFAVRTINGGIFANNNKAVDRFCTPENIHLLRKIKEMPGSATQISLGAITNSSIPACAILGCKTVEQVEDSMTAADFTMTAEQVESINLFG